MIPYYIKTTTIFISILFMIQEKKPKLNFNELKWPKEEKRELIERYYTSQPNFNNHYLFIELSCGSPCIYCVIIDYNTGKIYLGPTAVYKFDYKLDSKYIIIDRGLNIKAFPHCEKQEWMWDSKLEMFKRLK